MLTLTGLRREPVDPMGEHLNFVEPPFLPSPNPRFAFETESHARTVEAVTGAVSGREDVIVVTGDEGTGKTTLCLALSQRFDPRTSVSIILDPRLSADNLLQKALVDFRVAASVGLSGRATGDQHLALKRFLASLVPSQRQGVIVIDDAHDLPPGVLAEMFRASNFQANPPGLQIVLVGSPNLEDVLRQADIEGLAGRKFGRHRLTSIPDDRGVKQYIERRLWVARGGNAALSSTAGLAQPDGARNRFWWPRFTRSAIGVIARASRGNPRAINLICDRALTIARGGAKDQISARVARRAVADLGLQTGFRQVWRPSPKAAAVLVTLAASALLAASLKNRVSTQTITRTTPIAATPTRAPDQSFEAFRTDALQRAGSLSKEPDVRGLLRLEEEVQLWDTKTKHSNHEAVEGVLIELERLTHEARVRQLEIDRRLLLEASRTP